MSEYTKPTVGSFCWVEAHVSDPSKAKGFYGELFGWNAKDMPMPHGGAYTMLSIGGKNVAGLMQIAEEAKKMGALPNWLSYVAVDNIETSTSKAKELGATLLAGPMTAGPGKMTLIQDPTGAVLALWQQQESMGATLSRENNSLCWNELVTTDVSKSKSFYTQLFGWSTEEWPGNMPYTVLKNNNEGIGGLMATPKEMPNARSAWMVYFAVSDCDGTAKKAASMGAQLCVPPTDIPDVGRFCVIQDPQGAVFCVLKPMPKKS